MVRMSFYNTLCSNLFGFYFVWYRCLNALLCLFCCFVRSRLSALDSGKTFIFEKLKLSSTIFKVLFMGLICLCSFVFLFRNCTFETTDHEYDLSNCIWKSGDERYLKFMYVSVAAVQGGIKSEAEKSNTFSFNSFVTVDTKCKQCC